MNPTISRLELLKQTIKNHGAPEEFDTLGSLVADLKIMTFPSGTGILPTRNLKTVYGEDFGDKFQLPHRAVLVDDVMSSMIVFDLETGQTGLDKMRAFIELCPPGIVETLGLQGNWETNIVLDDIVFPDG